MNTSIETLLKQHKEPWYVAPAVSYPPTSVLADALYRAVRAVTPAISTRSRLPVLSHVHLFTREGCIYVEATDLEKPLREKAAARVNQDLDLCVPARPLQDWLQVTQDGREGGPCLELTWDPSVCILEVRVPRERTRATFKGLDAQEFPPIRDEDLKPRGAKPKTWAALCKLALKAGYSTLERLDGTTVPLLEALHNPAYKPARVRWQERPVNPVGEGDYWTLEVDQPETQEAEAVAAFPFPAIVRHNPATETVAHWKLGRGAVTITGEAPESAPDPYIHIWKRDHNLAEGEEAEYFDATDREHPVPLGHMVGDPQKNAEDLDAWVDESRWVQDPNQPHMMTTRLHVWIHRNYHAEAE